jgi:stage II sporulation protein D
VGEGECRLRRFRTRMYLRSIIISFILVFQAAVSDGQVKVRLFTDQTPGSVIFTVTSGEYNVNISPFGIHPLKTGSLVLIAKYGNQLVVKIQGMEGLICDSALFSGKTGADGFSLRTNGKGPLNRLYSGDLSCRPDLGTILLINNCDTESYIAGVVRAEGGTGKNIEFFKAQAILVRTYTFKYFGKHSMDKFNLCDDTHCQVFNGITYDSVINRASQETHGLVVLAPDSSLIISAFHSNCGGETAPSEAVWLTPQPYLKKITDPFCTSSRNAKWEEKLLSVQWKDYLIKSGYPGILNNDELLNFSQITRSDVYTTGGFSLPVRQIRTDFKFRSAFFSVTVSVDSVIFTGRGYGHGVGLCQEGAMVMASKGFDYRQIINFYYTGVRVADINEIQK